MLVQIQFIVVFFPNPNKTNNNFQKLFLMIFKKLINKMNSQYDVGVEGKVAVIFRCSCISTAPGRAQAEPIMRSFLKQSTLKLRSNKSTQTASD